MSSGANRSGVNRSKSIDNGIPNDATEYYVSGDGMWINQYLRGRGDFGELSADEKQYLKDLDKAADGTVKDKVLYRSVDASAIFGNLNDADADNLRQYLIYGENSFGKGAYADGIRNRMENIIGRVQGQTQTEKGFMSTTKDVEIAKEFGDYTGATRPIVMEIETNGAKGVDLSSYDRNVAKGDEQKEVLLARNQSYTIKDIGTKDGQIYIKVKMN